MIAFRKRGATYYIRGTVRLGRETYNVPERAIDAATDEEAERICRRVYQSVTRSMLQYDGPAVIGHKVGKLEGLRPSPATSTRVYAIWAQATDLVKFGTAEDVRRRFSQIKVSSPDVLHLVMDVPGDSALEREIHFRFREHRVRGEWFKTSAEVLEFLAGMVEVGAMPVELGSRLHAQRSSANTFEPDRDSTTRQSPEA